VLEVNDTVITEEKMSREMEMYGHDVTDQLYGEWPCV